MNKRADKVEVAIEELKDSNVAGDKAGVVLETKAVVDGARRDTSIEVHENDVPAVARAKNALAKSYWPLTFHAPIMQPA